MWTAMAKRFPLCQRILDAQPPLNLTTHELQVLYVRYALLDDFESPEFVWRPAPFTRPALSEFVFTVEILPDLSIHRDDPRMISKSGTGMEDDILLRMDFAVWEGEPNQPAWLKDIFANETAVGYSLENWYVRIYLSRLGRPHDIVWLYEGEDVGGEQGSHTDFAPRAAMGLNTDVGTTDDGMSCCKLSPKINDDGDVNVVVNLDGEQGEVDGEQGEAQLAAYFDLLLRSRLHPNPIEHGIL